MSPTQNSQTAELVAATQSLAASHEIVVELERAKRNIEQMIDGMTTSFAIISEVGVIYKANRLMAEYFNVSIEELLGHNVSEIFQPEVWEQFQEKEMSLINSERKHHVEFELPIIDHAGCTREILWSMRPLSDISGNFKRLYQVLGHDITKVKEYERKINVIFKHIPLGLFTINKKMTIEGAYSEHTKHLLASDSLDGRPFLDLLSKVMDGYIGDLQKKAFRKLESSFGKDQAWYEKHHHVFPSELQIHPRDKDSKYKIKISYYPVYIRETIDRYIVMIDRLGST
ncbi:MAG: PAS domain S-box protein [Pseudobacteriovorax sp.]|nr:PAS domain S-box protein [Pseudobacteriovorax sp.]